MSHKEHHQQQKSLTSFFRIVAGAGDNNDENSPTSDEVTKRTTIHNTKNVHCTKKRLSHKRHLETGSHFHSCPICYKQFPLHQLQIHASKCNGSGGDGGVNSGNDTTTALVSAASVTSVEISNQTIEEVLPTRQSTDHVETKLNVGKDDIVDVTDSRQYVANPMTTNDNCNSIPTNSNETTMMKRMNDNPSINYNINTKLNCTDELVASSTPTRYDKIIETIVDTSHMNGNQQPKSKTSSNGLEQGNGITSQEKRKDNDDSTIPNFHSYQPIPGLYVFDDFITEEEEMIIISELDGSNNNSKATKTSEACHVPWKNSNFNGPHLYKRWGVHCDLRSRKVFEAENPLPNFMNTILIPKLKILLKSFKCNNNCFQTPSLVSSATSKINIVSNNGTWVPNEANAIDYYKKLGHYLKSHVDDRQLSREIIANLSLAGNCYMTFQNVAIHRNTAVPVEKVLLNRRCLQLLTGKSRYDFSHGISHADLLSDRRISITMRQSPLSCGNKAKVNDNVATISSTKNKMMNVSTWMVKPKTTNTAPTTLGASTQSDNDITNNTTSSSRNDESTGNSNAKCVNIQPKRLVECDNSKQWWKKPRLITPGKDLDTCNNGSLGSVNVQMQPQHQEPIPGLLIFENFITQEEEDIILNELDDDNNTTPPHKWITERHSGCHREKRYGIDHDLWSSELRQPKYLLPLFMDAIIQPKLRQLSIMHNIVPNDINSIDYRRKVGHSLKQHVDDRTKHLEPIANLSLAGDCFMTFWNQNPTKNMLCTKPQKILLKQRTLFVMTGRVRYDFSHGIDNIDLLSDRRVSVTMRQTAKLVPCVSKNKM